MTTINKDTEYLLHHGDLHLRVSPFGASVRGLWRGDEAMAPGTRVTDIAVKRHV